METYSYLCQTSVPTPFKREGTYLKFDVRIYGKAVLIHLLSLTYSVQKYQLKDWPSRWKLNPKIINIFNMRNVFFVVR